MQGSVGTKDLRLSPVLSPPLGESTAWGSLSCPRPQLKANPSVFFRIKLQLALPTHFAVCSPCLSMGWERGGQEASFWDQKAGVGGHVEESLASSRLFPERLLC